MNSTKQERFGGKSILMVEDNDIDYDLSVRSMKKCNFDNPVVRCSDGEEALEYLFGDKEGKFSTGFEEPSMILLDLNLPGINGKEILNKLRVSERYKKTPVVILSTSSNSMEINRLYQMGANSYITKPTETSEMVRAFSTLRSFWYETAKLPNQL